MSNKQRLVLIDGHSVLFRAFYAFPYLTSPDGEMVNAVYGFSLILLRVIEELEPTHILVTFDVAAPTFRHTDFAGYKAKRKKAPSELVDQLGKVKEVVESLNIPIFEVEGYEADDVIGTLALQAKSLKVKEGELPLETVIVTGDLDALQLVDDEKVLVHIPGRRNKPAVMYDEGEVVKKMGVRPDQVVDLKGLAGDSSDNIPGVKGVGPKTAVSLLVEFGSIEGIYEAIKLQSREVGKLQGKGQDLFKKAGISEAVVKKLADGHEMAVKSKELATIVTDVPVKLDLGACGVHGYDKGRTLELFGSLGFGSLMGKLPEDEFERSVQDALF